MNLFEDTNPRDLKALLAQIHSRDAALPDFQRDFVWDPSATQELIVSIASNYPAGSLLRIRNTHNFFACREFEGAPALAGGHSTYLVLDGQQRLTSLYQAFYGVGDHQYFVDLRALMEGKDFEESIFHLRTNEKRAQALADPDEQARTLILPLAVLKDGASGFTAWALQMAMANAANEEKGLELQGVQTLIGAAEAWVKTIDDYQFPVVTLSDSTAADAVCTIFETLNRTGMKLSTFELLTARFWPRNVNLRDLWSAARAAHPILDDFEIDPYYVLQAVTLLARTPASCKRGDVLALGAHDVEEWWTLAVEGMAAGLQVLRDDCGVLIPRWLPYSPMVVTLAAALARQTGGPHHELGAKRQKLRRWFWCAALGQAYEGAVNSQTAKDYAEVVRWMDGGTEPEVVSAFRFDPRILLDTTPRQRALYRAAMCLILRNQSRDFHTGAPLTANLIEEQRIDDHHIFPQAYLGAEVASRLRDCVLNRTLIDRTTNILISAKAPSVYLAEIHQTYDADSALGEVNFDRLLESHLLPSGVSSPLLNDAFDAFLTWRQLAFWEQIRAVTGVQDAADLVVSGLGACR